VCTCFAFAPYGWISDSRNGTRPAWIFAPGLRHFPGLSKTLPRPNRPTRPHPPVSKPRQGNSLTFLPRSGVPLVRPHGRTPHFWSAAPGVADSCTTCIMWLMPSLRVQNMPSHITVRTRNWGSPLGSPLVMRGGVDVRMDTSPSASAASQKRGPGDSPEGSQSRAPRQRGSEAARDVHAAEATEGEAGSLAARAVTLDIGHDSAGTSGPVSHCNSRRWKQDRRTTSCRAPRCWAARRGCRAMRR
jgi:hypothetical protein